MKKKSFESDVFNNSKTFTSPCLLIHRVVTNIRILPPGIESVREPRRQQADGDPETKREPTGQHDIKYLQFAEYDRKINLPTRKPPKKMLDFFIINDIFFYMKSNTTLTRWQSCAA